MAPFSELLYLSAFCFAALFLNSSLSSAIFSNLLSTGLASKVSHQLREVFLAGRTLSREKVLNISTWVSL